MSATTVWKKANFHRRLLTEVFPDRLTDRDALLIMAILHSCRIQLSSPLLEGHPDLTFLEGITVNHAAEAISSLWKGTKDPRNNRLYWSLMWNGPWKGYARLEQVSSEDAIRSQELKAFLEHHPAVKQIIPEDWNPFVAENQ
jgi:hypothetical protein